MSVDPADTRDCDGYPGLAAPPSCGAYYDGCSCLGCLCRDHYDPVLMAWEQARQERA